MDIGYAEPAEPDDPLLAFDKGNVILQPHLAIAHRDERADRHEASRSQLWRATAERAIGAPAASGKRRR